MKNFLLAACCLLICACSSEPTNERQPSGILGPVLADGFPAYGKRCQGRGQQGDLYDVQFRTDPLPSGQAQFYVALSINNQEVFGPTGGFGVDAPGFLSHRHYYKVWGVANSSQFYVLDSAGADGSIPMRYHDGFNGANDAFNATCAPL